MTNLTERHIEMFNDGFSVADIARAHGERYTRLYKRLRSNGYFRGRSGMLPRNRIVGIPRASFVVSAVAIHLEIPVATLISASRKQDLVRGRTLATKVLADLGYSLPVITRAIGRENHTTALHLVRKARGIMESDQHFARTVAEIVGEMRVLGRNLP